jgi:hypothetical protein
LTINQSIRTEQRKKKSAVKKKQKPDEAEDFLAKDDFGKVPEYLHKIKADIAGE